ncbi:DUF3545 family protein [Catenovulum maritimum]|uniref:DUF3545 family protein n=1 Tax=Catenovulum maritimum TaxID=1513271 RepID=UPI00097BD0A4|nr:DUF3545 family protein [Catenovulum maritimum]
MELANSQFNLPQANSNNQNKVNKKRKWREIEAIMDQRNLDKELREIDEFYDLNFSE